MSSLKYLPRQGLAIRGHVEGKDNLMQLLLLHFEDSPSLKQYFETKNYLLHEIVK